MLTASRQDIDGSSRWNRSLLRAIPVAILNAVKQFNRGPMRHGWLCLLRERPSADDFFDPLDEMTWRLLSRQPVLMSSAGLFAKPSELFWVSASFRDRLGRPLLSNSVMDRKYISPDYDMADLLTLRRLGVREQSAEEFLSDLEVLLQRHPDDIWQRPPGWHSRLSTTLLSMMTHHQDSEEVQREYRQRISALQIIPLKTGTWVSSSSEASLVLKPEGGLDIPRGLELVEVDPTAGLDPDWQAFLLTIGVQSASQQLVCTAIASLHSGPSFRPASLPTADLIAHAKYYSSHHGNRLGGGHAHANCPQLWLRAQDGGCARGNELYMESSQKFSVRYWPDEFVRDARFLDGNYNLAHEEASDNRPKLVDWLIDCQGVQLLPRLVAPVGDGFGLSPQFKILWKTAPSSDILQLFKAHWGYYSQWIEDGGFDKGASWKTWRDLLIREIGMLQAACLDGKVFPLRQTLLPVKGLSATSPGLRGLLDVPSPDDSGWGFLRHFGVTAKIEPGALLDRLRELVTGGVDSSDQVSQIYFELLACDQAEKEMIR